MTRSMSGRLSALLVSSVLLLAACAEDPTGIAGDLGGGGPTRDPGDPPGDPGDPPGDPGDPPVDSDDPIVVGWYTLDDTTASGDTSSITEFSLDDWRVPEGDETWRVEDGALIAEGMVSQMVLLHESVEVGQASWIEVDIDHADDGGIVLRGQDEDSYYLVAIRDDETAVGPSGANSNVELYRFVDGVWDSFADYGGVDVDWPRGELATIKVWAIEDVILIFFNGVLVQSGQDATFATGALGLRTNAFFHTQLVPSMTRYRALRWGTF